MNPILQGMAYFNRAIKRTSSKKIEVIYIEQVDHFVPSPLNKKKLTWKPF